MKKHNNYIINEENHNYIAQTKTKFLFINKRSILIVGITLLVSIIFCYIYNNQNITYTLYGESKTFSYKHAIFNEAIDSYNFIHGDVDIKNDDINITSVELKSGDRLIIGSSEFQHGIASENKGYGELFTKEVVKNIDNWRIEVTYELDNKENTEIIELDAKKQ